MLERHDVQPEDRVHLGVVEHALIHHLERAARLARRRAFFGRLEDELHRPRQAGLHAAQDLGSPHQHRDVGVVSARMHHADFLPVERRPRRRLEGQVNHFRDRQPVHVGSQRHDASGQPSPEDADHTGFRHAGLDLQAKGPEVIGDDLRRADLAVRQLGVLMNIATPGDHLRHHALNTGVEIGAEVLSGRVRHRQREQRDNDEHG